MKKTIPLAIRNIVDVFAEDLRKRTEIVFPEEAVVRFQEKDGGNEFFFELESVNIKSGKTSYDYKFLPTNKENMNSNGFYGVDIKYFEDSFRMWRELVREYEKPSPVFDDLILQSYYEEIEPQFELIDQDANYKPFKIHQQVLIQNFLDNAIEYLSKSNNEESKGLISNLQTAKSELSKSPKAKVFEKIRIAISKAFKISLEVGQKLLVDFSAELVKKLIIE